MHLIRYAGGAVDEIEHIEVVPLSQKLNEELETARREAIAQQQIVEPTEEEKRNGWTAKALTAYLTDRLAAQSLSLDVSSLHRRLARRPNEANHHYRPLRWRT